MHVKSRYQWKRKAYYERCGWMVKIESAKVGSFSTWPHALLLQTEGPMQQCRTHQQNASWPSMTVNTWAPPTKEIPRSLMVPDPITDHHALPLVQMWYFLTSFQLLVNSVYWHVVQLQRYHLRNASSGDFIIVEIACHVLAQTKMAVTSMCSVTW